ncbi:unnamed protein product [Euphydryas editha]|uniref:Small-subunit processome Utp12 domain-containing protein n=1 Tax=Euphydryas editha TaxID=104508 RepID=A0AAU9VBD5_EUPED|nr:unnamed protein product [Euphydryas editha]
MMGHASGCSVLAVGPGGLYAVSCGADGALRLFARSDEPLVLGDQDDADEGLATGEQHAPVPGLPGLNMPTKKTIGAEKAADALAECVSLCAAHAAAGRGAPPPALMVAYGCDTPEDFLLETVRRIRSSELEEALLLLPFGAACEVVRRLPALLERGAHAELLCRLALFLLRVHRAPLAHARDLRKHLIQIQAKATLRLAELRDMVGFNVHALQWLQRDAEAAHGEQLFREAARARRVRPRRALKRPIVTVT